MVSLYRLFLIICVGFWARDARAFHLNLLGGYFLPAASVVSPSSPFGASAGVPAFGGGVLLGNTLTKNISIEWGLVYAPRGFVADTLKYSMTSMQVPFMIRFSWLKFFSIGLGAYYSYGLGSVSNGSATIPYGVTTFNQTDYGITAGLNMKMKLLKGVAIVLDARYLYGIPNASKIADFPVSYRDLQFMAGFRFGG